MVANATAGQFRVPLPYNNNNNKTDEYVGAANEQNCLEFEGTAVLCRVCGDKASGFHYGVHSCEGCKGFFRRSIQQKIQYRPCSKNQQCSVLRVNRNRCQYCRLKKCISVGMSRDAVRFGRVPKREKARIMAAMEASHIIKTKQSIQNDELVNVNELKSTIINAHVQTSEFTKNKIENLIKSDVEDMSGPNYSVFTCPLNPKNYSSCDDNLGDNFSDRFTSAVRGVVEFAKLLPGFNTLAEDDQKTLLKNGVFEVLLLRLSNMFVNDKMICINGKVISISSIEDKIKMESSIPAYDSNAKFLIKSMLKFAKTFNEWNLNDNIIGVFSAMVLMSWDRPGLSSPGQIKKIQSNYRTVLQTLLSAELCNTLESKIPDLRTLSTLHSEKLLFFQVDDNINYYRQTPNYAVSSSFDDDDVSMETEVIEGEMSHSNQFNVVQPGTFYCYNTASSGLTQFPVSPSNDSGVESGACSSPSRSEISETLSNADESFHFLKNTSHQFPCVKDTQCISKNLHSDEESYYKYKKMGHKKFRRSTLTPSEDMGRNTTSPLYQYTHSSRPQFRHEEFRGHDNPIFKNKIPLQLYPQLACALTKPVDYINVEDINMIKLEQASLNPLMICNGETSDYIHRLIMRNGLSVTETDENATPLVRISILEPDEVPLNLCIKKPKTNGFAT